MPLSADAAETLALKALGWLSGQPDLLGVFMGATGVSRDALAARASELEFLASVLDFLLMDDAWVIAFCDDNSVAYDQVMLARAALPGGAQMHWT